MLCPTPLLVAMHMCALAPHAHICSLILSAQVCVHAYVLHHPGMSFMGHLSL